MITELETWEDIATVTTRQITCIRPDGGSNHDRARQTWEVLGRDYVRYYSFPHEAESSPPGYIRIHRVNGSNSSTPWTWVVDYSKPINYEAIIELGLVLRPGSLLCKAVSGMVVNNKAKDERLQWRSIAAQFPRVALFPHHVQSEIESTWLVVP